MAVSRWDATVLTLFPQMFPGPLASSLAGKSLNQGIWTLKTLDIRDFASDKHRTVDDTPLGGGVGMGMRKSDGALRAKLNSAIASVKSDGTLNKMIAKWFGADAPQF